MQDAGMATDEHEIWPPRWAAIPVALCGAVTALLMGQFVSTAAAEAAGSSVAVIISVALIQWEERGRAWFITFLFAAALVHAAIWLALPWPANHRLERGDVLFLVVDLAVTLACAVLVEHLAKPVDPSKVR